MIQTSSRPTLRFAFTILLGIVCCFPAAFCQNKTQRLVFAGLRSVNQSGQVNSVQTDAAGDIYLLLNQGDGVRILKTDSAADAVLGQALLGAAGDVGVAMALDAAGNVYVTGTTTSTTLTGTSGAAIPNRTDTSTNSFVAKFDAKLNPLFVTFTGGSRIAAAAIAVTADAVFVTGITYSANLPVTSNGIQQAPAYGSFQNGFVEKFSSSGSTLFYATYLTGAAGDTTPAAIAADATDHAYLAGETSASGFPTIAALVPAMLSNPSGFLTELTPAGDGIVWSTFIPGNGLTSLALDSTGKVLLATGSVALGQFPVDTVTAPLLPLGYQVALQISIDGSTALHGAVLAPGSQSSVAADLAGGAWVDGALSAPALPLAPLASLGGGFAAHMTAAGTIDQTARFGGLPDENPSFACLPIALTSVAVNAAGDPLIAGSIAPTASSATLATETYDLPLRAVPTAALPSAVKDAEVSAASCSGSLCAGSAAYLAELDPTVAGPALTLSGGDLPMVVLRNLGSGEADGVQVSASGATVATNCPTALAAGAECDILLTGSGAATLTVSGSNATAQTLSFTAIPAASSTIAFFPRELDFGLQTSASATATRTITTTNLGTTSQTFQSALDATANPKAVSTSQFTETATDCTLGATPGSLVLGPGGTCHITIGFSAASTASSDGYLTADWLVGNRDVLLTGYSQAASLSVSASEIDFGTQYTNGLRLPRYLYLSNGSTATIAHTPLTLPAALPFAVTDGCPLQLLAGTVCRVRIDYLSAVSPSVDSVVLALDQGLSALLTGKTLPPQIVGGATVNPNLTVTPTSAAFVNAVAVTGVSTETQTVTITNSGTAAFSLGLAVSGDFADTTSCGTSLAGGKSCTVVVTFTPSQPGQREGLLAVTAGAGTSAVYVGLSGTGTAILAANNGTLDSGSVAVSQPVTTFYKVQQSFTSLTATVSGPFLVTLVEDAGFGPGTPPASAYATTFTGTCRNCYLGIRFLPSTPGSQTGTLTLTSAKLGLTYTLALTGTGLAQTGLLITPLTQDFGSVPVNSESGSQVFTVTNLVSGGSAVTVSTAVLSGAFAVDSSATGGQVCGGALGYGASCQVAVAFAPKAVGATAGSVTLTGGGATATAALTGVGITDPGVAIDPLGLTFNNVPGSASTARTVTVTNTGAAAVLVGTPSVTTVNFAVSSQCGTLAAGASCSLGVTFLPGVATVTDTLTLPVTTTGAAAATSKYTVALNGAYTASTAGLEMVPAISQFGASSVGQEGGTRQITIQNLTAKQAALTIAIPRQFALVGVPCTTLAANGSCSFTVAFVPLTNGDIAGTLYAQAAPGDGSAGLTGLGYVEGFGTGTGALTITGGLIVNGVYSFGQVTSGQTASRVFTVTNQSASGTVTVRRVTSGSPFLATSTCGMTLSAGQSCTVTVTYSPTNQVLSGTAGAPVTSDAGSLTIESDAVSGPDTINLTGQAAPLGVTSPSSSSVLATFTLSQSSLSFGQTQVGNVSAAQTVVFTNTGTATLHVSNVFATSDFQVQNGCGTVTAGASCSVTVSAVPQTAGLKIASLEIASDAAVSLEFVSLLVTGAPSVLTLSPTSLNFGQVQVGASATLPVQVTNTGSTAAVFSAVTASGDYSAGGSCPAAGGSLATGTSCTVQVTFRPTVAGTRTGTLAVGTSLSTNPLTASLTGVGTQSAVQILPSSLAFGSIALGSSANLSLTVTNGGTAPATGLVFAITGDYAVTVPCGLTVLLPAASCTVQVTFTPSALGPRAGTLSVASSDPGSPAVVPLSGTGIPGGGFTLTLLAGGATGAATVTSGEPANYSLAITPTGGFSGAVALTCTPITPAQYASCSIAPSAITLAGVAQTSVVTINTVTSVGTGELREGPTGRLRDVFFCLLMPGLITIWRGRRELRRRRPLLLALVAVSYTFLVAGCGGGGGDFNLRYSPAGVYQYQVTASSTSGVVITQTVTLNLTITPR